MYIYVFLSIMLMFAHGMHDSYASTADIAFMSLVTVGVT